MSSAPAVSVVMPVLRPHAVYFRAAVESLVKQTFRDWELVVVEDPSPDATETAPATEAILTEFAGSRIHYHLNPTRTSLVRQLNLGLELARAPLVARFDADDICETDRLAEQVEHFRRHPDIAILGSQVSIIDSQGQTVGYRRYPVVHAEIVRSLRRFNPLAHPSVVFRREDILAAGGYREFPGNEDYELWCRLARAGLQFANHVDPLLRYRIHAGSIKSTRLREILRGTLTVKRLHWADSLTWRDRGRMCLERAMIRLPPALVTKAFKWTQYQRKRPHFEQNI